MRDPLAQDERWSVLAERSVTGGASDLDLLRLEAGLADQRIECAFDPFRPEECADPKMYAHRIRLMVPSQRSEEARQVIRDLFGDPEYFSGNEPGALDLSWASQPVALSRVLDRIAKGDGAVWGTVRALWHAGVVIALALIAAAFLRQVWMVLFG